MMHQGKTKNGTNSAKYNSTIGMNPKIRNPMIISDGMCSDEDEREGGEYGLNFKSPDKDANAIKSVQL